jgi:flagellar motor switch protein FliG
MPATAVAPAVSELTGCQKAAILCMLIGSDKAALITQHLSQDEAEMISYEIARMEHVKPEVAEGVLYEWIETLRAANMLAAGGVEFAREVLERAFGAQRAEAILRRITSQLADTGSLHRLRNADPQQLGNRMRGEHPQTIALILSHLEPPQTAAVLKEIEPSVGSEVMLRMARMEKVSPEMLQLIERSLGAEGDLNMTQGMQASGGPAAVAEVLNLISPSLEKTLLEGLAMYDPELCEQIKNLMFVFEDLVSLDDRGLQRLLREVESKELALALKAASEELKNRIMGAMSQRAVAALSEEMEFLGPVRLRDVETAQASIVTQVRALEEAGEIVISSNTEDVLL